MHDAAIWLPLVCYSTVRLLEETNAKGIREVDLALEAIIESQPDAVAAAMPGFGHVDDHGPLQRRRHKLHLHPRRASGEARSHPEARGVGRAAKTTNRPTRRS